MFREFDESYQHVFEAAFDAGVRSAQELSDADLTNLRRYSGMVGLIAEHVTMTRERGARGLLADEEHRQQHRR